MPWPGQILKFEAFQAVHEVSDGAKPTQPLEAVSVVDPGSRTRHRPLCGVRSCRAVQRIELYGGAGKESNPADPSLSPGTITVREDWTAECHRRVGGDIPSPGVDPSV